MGTLKISVGELNDGVKKLFDSTTAFKEGTGEFAKEADGIETEVGGEIDNMITEATVSNVEDTSFVSEKNTNVSSVRFVIKTETIEIEDSVDTETAVHEKLIIRQKLLRLFGLY